MKNVFVVKNVIQPSPEQSMQVQVKEFIVSIVIMNGWLEVENIMKNENDEQKNDKNGNHSEIAKFSDKPRHARLMPEKRDCQTPRNEQYVTKARSSISGRYQVEIGRSQDTCARCRASSSACERSSGAAVDSQ